MTAKQALVILVINYPSLFTFKPKERKPIALGIHKVIYEQLSHLPARSIRRALHRYTSTICYLKSFERHTHRFDLLGNPVSILSKEDKAHARLKLKNALMIQKIAVKHCVPMPVSINPFGKIVGRYEIN